VFGAVNFMGGVVNLNWGGGEGDDHEEPFRLEMGRWLKEEGIIQRERTDAEMIALALFLYTKGLSTRQVARVLRQLGVKVRHVAIWNWVHKYSQRVDPKALWLSHLPRTLIVDDTALQLPVM